MTASVEGQFDDAAYKKDTKDVDRLVLLKIEELNACYNEWYRGVDKTRGLVDKAESLSSPWLAPGFITDRPVPQPPPLAGTGTDGTEKRPPLDFVKAQHQRFLKNSRNGSWTIGQQVNAEQTRRYFFSGWYGFLFLLVDAWTCGLLVKGSACVPFVRVRERHVAVVDIATKNEVSCRTLLRSEPSSSLEYMGHLYTVVLGTYRLASLVVVLMLVMFALFCDVLLHVVVDWRKDPLHWLLVAFSRVISVCIDSVHVDSAPWLFVAIGMLFFSIATGAMYVINILIVAPRSLRYYDITRRDVPTVLPLVVKPRVPFAMVSYQWNSMAEFSRSLAAALPQGWVDVQMLSAGTNLTRATSYVAANCFYLVIVASGEYMKSQNCMVELIAALSQRRDDQYVSVLDVGTAPRWFLKFLNENLPNATIHWVESENSVRSLTPVGAGVQRTPMLRGRRKPPQARIFKYLRLPE